MGLNRVRGEGCRACLPGNTLPDVLRQLGFRHSFTQLAFVIAGNAAATSQSTERANAQEPDAIKVWQHLCCQQLASP